MSEWTRWSASGVSEEQARQIANQYFLQEQDRLKIGHALGMGRSLDVEFLVHPLVRRAIVNLVLQMRNDKMYTREEHLTMLKKIRDHCITDENWKLALASEVSLGKAAGLYENIGNPDDQDQLASNKPVESLDTKQIEARLEKLRQLAPPAPAEDTSIKGTVVPKPFAGGEPPF